MRHHVCAIGVLSLTALTACSSGSGAAPPASPTPSAATTPSAPASTDEAAGGPAPGTGQVAAAVKAFYDHYAANPTDQDTRAFLTDAAAAAVFAPGADVDRVYCAQNTPTSLAFAPPVLSDGEARVVVTTRWSGSTDRRITVTVVLPDILIAKIDCPPG